MTDLQNRPSWDQLYMTMCYLVAMRSQDRSTHAGSVIVAPDHTIRSIGYNDLPRGIEDEGALGDDGLPSRRSRIDGAKYMWTEHAERNAVYNAGRNGVSLIGCTLYVNWLPCDDCARAIIQSGIKEVVIHEQGQQTFLLSCGGHDKWTSAHQMVWDMMTEAKLDVRWFSEPIVDIRALFSSKLCEFDQDANNWLLER